MTISVDALPDGKTVQISIGNAVLRMNAGQIDAFIGLLAGARAQIVPAVPEDFPQGKPTHRHDSTKWVFGIDAATASPFLTLRSPAFGWLSFVMPFDEAERLGTQMQAAKNHPLVPSMRSRN